MRNQGPPREVRDLVLSQGTFPDVPTPQFLDAAASAGFRSVCLWLDRLGQATAATARQLSEYGLAVAAVTRVGNFTDPSQASAALEHDRQAIEDAVTLGAAMVVLVAGPVITSFADAEREICRGMDALLPVAEDAGMRVGLEVFHPMFAAERSAIVSLSQANDLLERYQTDRLGLVIDSYHVWWDPRLGHELRRSGDRILLLQIADWLVPATHMLRGRGVPGDGVIPLRSLIADVRAAGYDGPIEVEVINDDLGGVAPAELARHLRQRTEALV